MTFQTGCNGAGAGRVTQRLRGGWKFIDQRAEAGVCPADKSMVQTTLYFGLSRRRGKTSPLKSGNSLSTVTSRRAFATG